MVVVHPEYAYLILGLNDLKDEIANLIVEKEFFSKFVCEEIQVDYILKIGVLEYKLLVAGNKYKQNLRRLEIIDEKISQNKKVNMSSIDKQIKSEFKSEIFMEQNFSESIDFAIDATVVESRDYDIIDQMNDDYLKLQKLYNPIFDLKFSEEKEKFYKKIEKYYQKCNYKKLHKLAEAYNENELFQDEISNLKILTERYMTLLQVCRRQLSAIKNTFPYNQKVILEDEILLRRKKDSLNRQIADLEDDNQKVQKKIDIKLKKLKELP